MSFKLKHYIAFGCVTLFFGAAALVAGGWYWVNYVYDDPGRAKKVAHDMADYEFPGREVGVLSVDLFEWYRIASTRSPDRNLVLFLYRHPFTSEPPEEVRAEVFADMHESLSVSGPGEEQSWSLCGTPTTIVHRTGDEAETTHVYEGCVRRGDALFCTATVGIGSRQSQARKLLRGLECN